MSDLGDKLAGMIADLQGHIERRAHEIAEPRITEAHQTSQTVVDNMMAKAATEEQRLKDLVAELRRQIDAQVRRAERAEREQNALQATATRVRALRGRSSMGRVNDYVPLADVHAALDAPKDPGGES